MRLETSSAGGTYYALQYGVFSSPERAEQAKLELTQAGIGAGSDPEDGNRVYAGISADREEAKLLSTRLKSQGVELYVKEIVNPEVNPAIFGNKQEDASLFSRTALLLSINYQHCRSSKFRGSRFRQMLHQSGWRRRRHSTKRG